MRSEHNSTHISRISHPQCLSYEFCMHLKAKEEHHPIVLTEINFPILP